MKLPTLNPFRALATWWRNRRPVKDAEFWALRDEAVGHVVTVKYFARGVKDKPRHAQFKDFRPEFDR